jgi:hypothetical protein
MEALKKHIGSRIAYGDEGRYIEHALTLLQAAEEEMAYLKNGIVEVNKLYSEIWKELVCSRRQLAAMKGKVKAAMGRCIQPTCIEQDIGKWVILRGSDYETLQDAIEEEVRSNGGIEKKIHRLWVENDGMSNLLSAYTRAEEEMTDRNKEIDYLMNDAAHLRMKIDEWYKFIVMQLYEDGWMQTTMIKL